MACGAWLIAAILQRVKNAAAYTEKSVPLSKRKFGASDCDLARVGSTEFLVVAAKKFTATCSLAFSAIHVLDTSEKHV